MIGAATVLAIVTARGGSKGLPGKHLREAGGKPLIDYTIAAARQARAVDRLVLSTDDERIADAARRAGCEVPFMRSAALARDDTPSIDVILDTLDRLPPYDIVVLLQPTSPLRSAQDIDAACDAVALGGAPSCVSVTEAEQSPYWMYALEADRRLRALLPAPATASRRQDLPAAYVLNGAVYAARTAWLRQHRSFLAESTVAHLMPRRRSIDIDTLEDFEAFVRALDTA
jgi:CMP-N,N'-diacetyllegionaminic acid synthase